MVTQCDRICGLGAQPVGLHFVIKQNDRHMLSGCIPAASFRNRSICCRCVSASAAAGKGGLSDELYNAVMLFEPNAIEIAMAELRRVLRAEARHASTMRKRAGKLPIKAYLSSPVHSLIFVITRLSRNPPAMYRNNPQVS